MRDRTLITGRLSPGLDVAFCRCRSSRTRAVFCVHKHFIETYFSTFKGCDFASDGYCGITGRVETKSPAGRPAGLSFGEASWCGCVITSASNHEAEHV
jgi:hypothetical protein